MRLVAGSHSAPPCRVRRGRRAPRPGGETCSGWPIAGCRQRCAAGRAEAGVGTCGLGMAEALRSRQEDEAPKRHIFLPPILAAHLWAKSQVESRRATRGPGSGAHPTPGKAVAFKSGFEGPGAAGVLQPALPQGRVQAPGPPWCPVCGGVSTALCCLECPKPGVLAPLVAAALGWECEGSTGGGRGQVQAWSGDALPRSGGTPGHPCAEQAHDQQVRPLSGTQERAEVTPLRTPPGRQQGWGGGAWCQGSGSVWCFSRGALVRTEF